MWLGLNYLFIVNLFIYVCVNDFVVVGVSGIVEKFGFLCLGLEYWFI